MRPVRAASYRLARNFPDTPTQFHPFSFAILLTRNVPTRMEATPAATNPPRNMKGGPQDLQQKVESRYATEFKDLDEPLRDFVKRKSGIINLPRPVKTDFTTLILLPLSGAKPTCQDSSTDAFDPKRSTAFMRTSTENNSALPRRTGRALRRRTPNAVEAKRHTMRQLSDRDRSALQRNRVEHGEIAAILRTAIDRREQIPIALT